MEILAPVIDFVNLTKVQNAQSGSAPKDYVTVDQLSVGYSAVNITATTHTVGTESFIRGSGTNAIAVTIPIGRVEPLTIKHVGTQDMTIVLDTSVIDDNSNLILRGNKKNAVTLHFQGGKAWVT